MKQWLLSLALLFTLTSCVPLEETPSGAAIGKLPPPMGPKKLIAIADFENKTNVAGQIALGSGMAEQLTDALIKSGHFIVLERQDVKGVLEEQNFGASGRTTTTGGARIGEMNRAQILIKGAVTEFSHQESGGGQGFTYEGVNLNFQSSTGQVAVIIYLYDTTTGQVIDSQRCEGKAESGGLAVAYSGSDFSFDSSSFKETPLGKATQKAIDNAVYYIVQRMARVPWQGRVVQVKGDQVYLNTGATGGIQVGDEFDVYREGEALVDPESGLNLGAELTPIGKVQVVEVQDKFSKAVPVAGSGFDKNNVVKFVARPAPEPAIVTTPQLKPIPTL